jgi:hypothetical protein
LAAQCDKYQKERKRIATLDKNSPAYEGAIKALQGINYNHFSTKFVDST